jgi:phenylalanyl-tRNA synthetase beta chain
MGGANTAIDENTRRIVVESATFNLYNLRGTQFRHGIFSEAITRFTKGQPPALTDFVVREFINMTERDLGLKVISDVVDAYPKPVKPSVVKITTDQVNGLLGTDFTFDEIIMTLENVGFKVKLDNGILRVVAPWWRTDIHIAEDVIEEVGRLNGYDEIPTQLPRRGFASPTDDELGELKAKLRKVLSDAGANEVLTYSFVSERLLRNVGQDPKNSYKIVNSISPQLQYVRQSLTPSLLEKTYTNIKVPYDHFALFEINQVYQKAYGLNEEKVPVLRDKVSLVVANRKASGDAYYEALNYALMLLQSLNIPVCIVALKDTHASNAPFEPARSAQLKTLDHKICFGVVGEYRQMVRRNLKLPEYTAGFELNVDEIFVYQGKTAPKTPVDNVVSNDLTFRVGADLEYAKLENLLQKNLESKSLWYQLTPISIYQGEDSKTKNISFRLNFANYEKTLSGKEIASIINGIANNVKKNLKGEMI